MPCCTRAASTAAVIPSAPCAAPAHERPRGPRSLESGGGGVAHPGVVVDTRAASRLASCRDVCSGRWSCAMFNVHRLVSSSSVSAFCICWGAVAVPGYQARQCILPREYCSLLRPTSTPTAEDSVRHGRSASRNEGVCASHLVSPRGQRETRTCSASRPWETQRRCLRVAKQTERVRQSDEAISHASTAPRHRASRKPILQEANPPVLGAPRARFGVGYELEVAAGQGRNCTTHYPGLSGPTFLEILLLRYSFDLLSRYLGTWPK